MASKSKTLFTVNSIMSTVILSMVLASTAQRYQTEALQIPADNEPSLQSMARNEASLSHRADSNYYLVDEANYPNDGSVQSLPNKRAWSNLHGSWGKRSANGVVYSDANNIDPDSGNDEYVDLMLLLLNQPYIRNAENADLNRPAAHEYANANDLPNENKRAWTFNDYWPIRFNTRNSANRYRGRYLKLGEHDKLRP